MKKFLGKFIQYIGATLAMCGVVCTMLEADNLVASLLVGFGLLIVGATVCYFGLEVESAR